MIYPSADKLENWGSKYSLVVLAAKRAKQLKNGAPVMIETDSVNPLTVALEEIAAGKILCRTPETDEVPAAAQEPEVAQLLAIPEGQAEEAEETAAAGEASEEKAAVETEAKGSEVSEEKKPAPKRKRKAKAEPDADTETDAAEGEVDTAAAAVDTKAKGPDVSEEKKPAAKPKTKAKAKSDTAAKGAGKTAGKKES